MFRWLHRERQAQLADEAKREEELKRLHEVVEKKKLAHEQSEMMLKHLVKCCLCEDLVPGETAYTLKDGRELCEPCQEHGLGLFQANRIPIDTVEPVSDEDLEYVRRSILGE